MPIGICQFYRCKILTALSSPRFPHLAKCALKLALELPAATPHRALKTLEKLKSSTRIAFGSAGERQSSIMAASLNTSAARRYILHSGSSAAGNNGSAFYKFEM